MITAVVPVNELGRTKSRLRGVLTGEERKMLTLAMLEDTVRVLRAVEPIDRVVVVSRDPEVLDAARAVRAEPFRETAGTLNGALEEVVRAVVDGGAALALPVDLPRIGRRDVLELITALRPENREPRAAIAPRAVIAPSWDGGTGAIAQFPATAVPFRFGPDSFEAHLRAARERGVPVRVVRSRNLALDLDRSEDLWSLLSEPVGPATRAVLERLLARRGDRPAGPQAEKTGRPTGAGTPHSRATCCTDA